ncbi:NAD-dependent epimerase/dehydratase family protein [Burkholderia gladioli]|uniref:NAD-dependent epimerase/dehydratase family protein n=1 Tax=Burkholderia gladioli TaxID=28095 RepID=UPI00064AAAAD|nr:NAD-dependent epimerase/dehydratase family protein [Burkholderia gladioli]
MTPSDSAGRRRALVTGLAGFTGRYVAEALEAAGYEVWGTVSPEAAPAADPALARASLLRADLLDPAALREAVAEARPDAVIHLAALAHVADNDPSDLYLVNVVGTRNLLAALDTLEVKPRCVLLASSANIYGNARVESIDESVPPDPANDYAVSKLAMEYAARLWSERLPIVIARPFNYTGVGQRENFLLPKLVAHYASHAPRISLGNLDVSRDFSDVRDVAAAYVRLVEAAPIGETFNVCSERACSLTEVLAMLARIAGYVIDVTVDPRFVRDNEVKILKGSRAKLRERIGELPVTPLEQTLRWMMEAARAAEGAASS